MAGATPEAHEATPQGFQQLKMPLCKAEDQAQLDLFATCEGGYEFRVIVTDSPLSARKALIIHKGSGTGRDLFAEIKDQTRKGYALVLDNSPHILLIGSDYP